MPLHPDIEAYLDLIEMGRMTGKSCAMHQREPAQARADFDKASLIMAGTPAGVHIRSIRVPVRDGAMIDARIYSRTGLHAAQPAAALIYFHGGGYVVGSLDSHDGLCRQLAAGSDSVVVAVAYRLAPEHRFPSAVFDAIDAVNWIGNNVTDLGLDRGRIAFGGDSAGGTLATVLAITAVHEPQVLAVKPYLQLLIYPVIDATAATESLQRLATGHLLETETLHWFYRHYARNEDDKKDWRFSPLLAQSVAGVAPARLLLAEYDPLVDEGLAYVGKLRAAGVDVALTCHAGMPHDFLRMSGLVPEILSVFADIGAALKA